MKSTDIQHNDMGTVYAGALALVAVILYAAWQAAHAEISYVALKWAWYQLGCINFDFAPQAISHWRIEIASLAAAPGGVSLDTLVRWLNVAGYTFIWIPVLLTTRGISRAIKHPANHTRRPITAATLPRIMSQHSPAVIPSLYYGDLLNSDPEEHKGSLNPEEWVAKHALLINGKVDRDKCLTLLTADLGAPITALNDMAPQEKALFAVFGARLLADGHDHSEAQRLLDQLNRSCHTGTWQGKRGYPDLSLTDATFTRYAAHPDAAVWLAKHRYPRTLLHSMHKEALAFGRLPSSHFRWLKGMDRGLWYALNTTGRKAPFIESAAVFTQALWETFAFNQGYRLTAPCLDGAADGVEAYLAKIGLLAAHEPKE